MTLAADFELAQNENDELRTASDVMRYVAALNPDATRKQFVAAAVAAGYRPNSATNRFNESRNMSVEMGEVLNPDGTLVE